IPTEIYTLSLHDALPILLACARIGAVHSVVFGGFSAQSIADRINDAQCKLVITADGSFRGTKVIELKDIVDDALGQCKSVERVIDRKSTRLNSSHVKMSY